MLNNVEAAFRVMQPTNRSALTNKGNDVEVKRVAALVNYMQRLVITAVVYLKATSKTYDDIAWR
jgi:hypothetical protein